MIFSVISSEIKNYKDICTLMGSRSEILALLKRWEIDRKALNWTHFPWLNSIYNPTERIRLVLSVLGIATAVIGLIIAFPS
jgi:hypothetical protein